LLTVKDFLEDAHPTDCLQVSFGGGIGGLVVDTIGHSFSQKYHNRVIQVRFMPFSYCPLKIILFLINNLHLLNDSYVTITKFNYAA